MSTSSIWSASRTTGVGDRLVLLDAGDLLDDVVHRLEVLHVHRGDHVDARVEELVDVLPPLLVARAGDVGVGELVDEHALGLAGEDRVDVHLLEGDAAVVDLLARDHLERRRAAPCVFGAPVRLEIADDDVAPALARRLPSLSIA